MQLYHYKVIWIPDHPDYDQLRRLQHLIIVAAGRKDNPPHPDAVLVLFPGSERLLTDFEHFLYKEHPELLV